MQATTIGGVIHAYRQDAIVAMMNPARTWVNNSAIGLVRSGAGEQRCFAWFDDDPVGIEVPVVQEQQAGEESAEERDGVHVGVFPRGTDSDVVVRTCEELDGAEERDERISARIFD